MERRKEIEGGGGGGREGGGRERGPSWLTKPPDVTNTLSNITLHSMGNIIISFMGSCQEF